MPDLYVLNTIYNKHEYNFDLIIYNNLIIIIIEMANKLFS